ncbi:MAG TPA: hypothetical protein VK207_05285 [Bacteroidales bacterium]|nr:hypothetical protein [Bacteroidales bacterium]
MLKQVTIPDSLKFFLILAINGTFFFASGCRDAVSARGKGQLTARPGNVVYTEINNTYINYRSFENPDKTWGFTIFVNSMPFRHYSRIPFNRASSGFVTKEEADKVAGFFINLIRSGDQSPRLDRRSIDTLGITVNKRKTFYN